MPIKDQIERDIKSALLAGNKELTTTLKGLKTAIQYAEVAKGTRDLVLTNDEVVQLFSKEAKKRQESADMFRQGGGIDRAELEDREKQVILGYLPTQLSEDELKAMVTQIVGSMENPQMGPAIGAVKAKTGASADGAMIARLVKEAIGS